MQYTVMAMEAQRHDYSSLGVWFLHTSLATLHAFLWLMQPFGKKSDVPYFPLTSKVVIKPSQI